MSDDNFAPDHLEGVEYIMRKQNNDLLGGIIAQQQTRIEELEAKLAQQDDLVQAAVAAALTEADEAVQSVASNCTTEDGHVAIIAAVEKVRSLITDDAQAALDRLVAAERTMMPIATAPRDGTFILVTPYGDPTDLQVSWFIDGEDRWANWSWSVEPSHWFPLPATL